MWKSPEWLCVNIFFKGFLCWWSDESWTIKFSITFFFSALYINSQRGNKLLLVNSYTYSYQKTYASGERWKCSTHQHKGCKAYIYVNSDKISSLNGSHNHSAHKFLKTPNGYIKIWIYKYYRIYWFCSTSVKCIKF